MNVLQLIEFEEGYRELPYYCSEGYPTIGIGTKLGPKGADLDCYDFTCPRPVAYAWLQCEVDRILKELYKRNWFDKLCGPRSSIIISMAYQIGLSGLLMFKKMIAAINAGDWEEAAKQALDSRWAKQTPARAKRHAEVLRTGSFEGVY